MGNIFVLLEGGCYTRTFLQIFAIADFSSKNITGKTLSVRKDIIGNTNLGQESHLNLEKFGLGNDCRSSP